MCAGGGDVSSLLSTPLAAVRPAKRWLELGASPGEEGSQEGYLKKTVLRSAVINLDPMWDNKRASSDSGPDQQGKGKEQPVLVASVDADSNIGDINDDDYEDDGVYMVSEGCRQVLQYEYHILYSCSYSTPVLYFRVSSLDGRGLSLEEVWSSVHPNFRLRLQKSPLNAITQQEHPLLGQPFFMLHPCRTEEFMKPVLQVVQDKHRPFNYILTWLSVMGPVVGLDIPLKYASEIHLATSFSSTDPD
ncbi:ubiquitin-like-conjugating enzyme ATG10 isoform X2 [Mastacembelus armatus]|uniref:ubiquitin-like-conjugating enzyme ATG10 isoform X2 n=1 Tax=Mastacembelus armatus TaxID=205130 RepID=UPI000E462644|nr:ubiquitin-like-conjugating enzyme ATG10 isoform X2 [Mastacembelus armatus]